MISYLQIDKLTKSFGDLVLFEDITFGIAQGQKVGLIAKNGTGKTTLLNIIAGKEDYDSGAVVFRNDLRVGYLEQTPHYPDGLTVLQACFYSPNETVRLIAEYEQAMASGDHSNLEDILLRMDNLKAWDYEQRAKQILGQLKIYNFDQKVETLSGGQLKRVALANVLITDPELIILDEPTNHLDADSIEWLRGYLKKYEGGFLVISHSTELLDEVVNKVWHLDAQLGQIDMYSLGWKAYLHQRVVDEERRRREREVAEKKAERLMQQGIRLHAKATKAVAAQNMMRRAEKLLENTSEAQKKEKVADIRFPEPAPCGRTPIMAKDISKAYGSNIVFAGVNLAIDKGSRVVILGYNGAGKTTTLRLLAHLEDPDTGSVEYGHGCKIGYFAQEHDTLDLDATVLQNLIHVAPELDDTQARSILGSFLFSGDDALKPARVLSGGEKTRLALATLVTSRANVLLLDEPTNNLDPASRDEILKAIAKYEGAIVLVTHDEGAVEALNPERVLLMPDGDEDLWNDSYLDLVAEE